MFTGMLHMHKTTVILFVVFYLIKLIGFLLKSSSINNFFAKKPVRITEMVISTLFLATGLYLVFSQPLEKFGTEFFIKIILVVISIPISIVGFKKNQPILATMGVLFLFMAYYFAEKHKRSPKIAKSTEIATNGAEIFKVNCITCHGENGAKMLAGAKDLSKSTLSDTDAENIIKNGKNSMQAYGKVLSDAEIKMLVEHIKTLRK